MTDVAPGAFQLSVAVACPVATAMSVSAGGVWSNLSVTDCVARFPAASRHVAVTAADAESGPAYGGDVHAPGPESVSAAVAFSATGFRYQPFPSGGRAGDAVIVGGVLSIFTSRSTVTSPSGPDAVHVTMCGPSVVSVCGSHPDVELTSPATSKRTPTSETNQSLAPRVPVSCTLIV